MFLFFYHLTVTYQHILRFGKLLLRRGYYGNTMAQTVTVKKKAIVDLLKVKQDFDSIIESSELSSDKKFMNSYNRAKKQVKNRDFVNWNEL